MAKSIWWKFVEDRILVGKEWATELNDGATILDNIAPVTDPSITLEYITKTGTITKYWLSGGIAGASTIAKISITTSDDEVLSDYVTINVKPSFPEQ